jgi:hypothetical protein
VETGGADWLRLWLRRAPSPRQLCLLLASSGLGDFLLTAARRLAEGERGLDVSVVTAKVAALLACPHGRCVTLNPQHPAFVQQPRGGLRKSAARLKPDELQPVQGSNNAWRAGPHVASGVAQRVHVDPPAVQLLVAAAAGRLPRALADLPVLASGALLALAHDPRAAPVVLDALRVDDAEAARGVEAAAEAGAGIFRVFAALLARRVLTPDAATTLRAKARAATAVLARYHYGQRHRKQQQQQQQQQCREESHVSMRQREQGSQEPLQEEELAAAAAAMLRAALQDPAYCRHAMDALEEAQLESPLVGPARFATAAGCRRAALAGHELFWSAPADAREMRLALVPLRNALQRDQSWDRLRYVVDRVLGSLPELAAVGDAGEPWPWQAHVAISVACARRCAVSRLTVDAGIDEATVALAAAGEISSSSLRGALAAVAARRAAPVNYDERAKREKDDDKLAAGPYSPAPTAADLVKNGHRPEALAGWCRARAHAHTHGVRSVADGVADGGAAPPAWPGLDRLFADRGDRDAVAAAMACARREEEDPLVRCEQLLQLPRFDVLRGVLASTSTPVAALLDPCLGAGFANVLGTRGVIFALTLCALAGADPAALLLCVLDLWRAELVRLAARDPSPSALLLWLFAGPYLELRDRHAQLLEAVLATLELDLCTHNLR